tara:strand:+ start:741 stop:1343 length:603 start_codon:yes stop_codon:yes gene_type:complete
MGLIVVLSNILVQFRLGNWLTYGAITYPFAFLINDLTNRFYGSRAARQVLYTGFVVGVVCSFAGSQLQGEFGPLVTIRIAIASSLAFLTAQFLDIIVFDQLRNYKWWIPPAISSTVGAIVDTVIFFFIAFSSSASVIDPRDDVSWAAELTPILGFGPNFPLWVSLASADFFVKLLLIIFALFPFWLVSQKYTQISLNVRN